MPPVKTIASKPEAGLKKNKTRITILFACNSTGTEKLDLFFIGNALQPRAFKKSTAAQLGIQYTANKKAWMTSSLFSSWLQRLDAYVGQTPGRHILLLLDNCSAHGMLQKPLTELHNITLHFLPPNTTSRVQPLDAGIIAAFKKLYRARQYSQALLEAEMGGTDIYKIDLLTAIRISQQIWEGISTDTIKNCWKHTGLVDWGDAVAPQDDGELEQEIGETLRRLAEVSVGDVIHPPGEEEEEEEVVGEEEDLEEAETPPGTPPRPSEMSKAAARSTGEEIEVLEAARAILQREGLLDFGVLTALNTCSSRLGQK